MADGGRVTTPDYRQRCTGASDCPEPLHVHGCYADDGFCDDPEDHKAGRGLSHPLDCECDDCIAVAAYMKNERGEYDDD